MNDDKLLFPLSLRLGLGSVCGLSGEDVVKYHLTSVSWVKGLIPVSESWVGELGGGGRGRCGAGCDFKIGTSSLMENAPSVKGSSRYLEYTFLDSLGQHIFRKKEHIMLCMIH